MTMLTKDEVIIQLRAMNQRQKDTLEAIRNKLLEGERDKVAPSILVDNIRILVEAGRNP